MKTIAITKYGSTDEFKEIAMDRPTPKANEVLVKIHAFSINPMDIAGRMGALGTPFTNKWSFPLVLGWDFSGIVVQIGSQITDFKVGDRVFGSAKTAHEANNGTYSEYVATDTTELTHLPDGLTFDQAAALPIGGVTAYYGMNHSLKLQPGQKILIQGGAGGVGLFAVQIAKAFGAYVATTASENHRELLESLGADQVIDYHKESPADVLNDFDAVFDTVGDIDTGLKVLKPEGKLITIAAQPTKEQKNASFQFTHGTGKDLDALAELVLLKKIKLEIQSLPFSVESVVDAHKSIEGRHTIGKIVIHEED